MKLIIKNISSALDDRVHSFECIVITEEEYEEYKKYSCGSDYIATNKWILRLVRKKQKDNVSCYIQPISTYLKICCCQQNIDDNSRQYNVEIFNGKEMISAIFDGTILTAIGCRDLLKFGCIYNESAVNHLLQYLTNSAHSAPIKNVHTSLGWRWEQGSPIFLSSKCISKIGFQSEYVGQLAITPKGSLDVWLDMIRAEVIGNIPLTFVMLTGFASILLGYLNHSFDLGCLVFNLTNTSSRGKTTAGMVCVSTFGSAAFDRGLITTMNSTQNAIIAFISQANSHTVVFDEAATAERGSLRKLLYQICSGRDIMRFNEADIENIIGKMQGRSNTPKRACGYCRFSSDHQREESIEAQQRIINDYAEKNGYEIVEWYIDRAYSGKTVNRPDFQRLLNDISLHDCPYKTVIVHKMDRFSRSAAQALEYKEIFHDYGVELVSTVERINNDANGKLLYGIMTTINQYYIDNLGNEVMKGLKENALKAQHNGGKPCLGYKIVDKHYVIEESEAVIIRKIFQMAADGYGYNTIIKEMNALGYKTKAGKPWRMRR